jgi:deoxyribonuclease V
MKLSHIENLNLDLYQLTWDLTAQIPKGMVTTYGEIAKALGDIRASRAVGMMEHANPRPVSVPCHRVVYRDGGLAGYSAQEGVSKKARLLRTEGVEIKHNRITDLKNILFSDFKLAGRPPLNKLRTEQYEMSQLVSLKDSCTSDDIKSVVGVDVSYSTEYGFGAAVVIDINNHKIMEQVTCRKTTRFPYIPTYLSYHELPIIFELLKKLKEPYDAVLFDGNGVLHPLGLGLASHAGVLLQAPTFGVAKKLLCGKMQKQYKYNKHNKNQYQEETRNNIIFNNKMIGIGFMPKTARTRWIFISPGNMISFESSYQLTKRLCKTRIPEPIKAAHRLALDLRKGSEL